MNEEIIKELVSIFSSFKTIPNSSILKLAKEISFMDINDFDEFVYKLKNAKKDIFVCEKCNLLSKKIICKICSNIERENKLLILEDQEEINKFEDSKTFFGKYYVVPILFNKKNIQIKKFNIEIFNEHCEKFDEIILGISQTEEGILTTKFLKNNLKHKKISELARGIPYGVSIKYIDNQTIEESLKNRKESK